MKLMVRPLDSPKSNFLASRHGNLPPFSLRIVADEKEFPISSLKTAPEQTYVNFFDLKFPKSAITSYVDDFLKIQGYSKDLSESEKVLRTSFACIELTDICN